MSGSLSAAPTALITGANAGVGYETARWIAAGGANVILHAPTLAAGEDAARDLVAAGVDPHCLDLVAADFTSLEQVMSMASTVVTRHRRLDLLVNNAALVAAPTRSVTVDGNEATFQVNYCARSTAARWKARPSARPPRSWRRWAPGSSASPPAPTTSRP